MASAKPTTTPVTAMEQSVDPMVAFLERAAIAQAPAWRPESGGFLSGPILGFRMGSTDEWGDYPVIVVQSDQGPLSFHCFHSLVRERLAELQPKKGDLLTVQYLGTKVVNGDEDKPEADQKKYHRYYIESGSVEASPVLDEMKF